MIAPGASAEPLQLALILLGLGLGLGVALWGARRDRGSRRALLSGVLPAALGAALLGHAAHLALTGAWRWDAPWQVLLVYEGGFNSLGVYTGAFLAAMLWWRLRDAPAWALADAAAPGLVLGAALARLGCLPVGCDFGVRAADGGAALPVALQYPPASAAWLAYPDAASALTPPLHPMPLYEALPALALVGAVLWRPRLFGRHTGQRAAGLAAAWLAVRFVSEGFRGGVAPLALGSSALQLAALLGVTVFVALWRQRATPAPKPKLTRHGHPL